MTQWLDNGEGLTRRNGVYVSCPSYTPLPTHILFFGIPRALVKVYGMR
jgi:hypothetical protein